MDICQVHIAHCLEWVNHRDRWRDKIGIVINGLCNITESEKSLTDLRFALQSWQHVVDQFAVRLEGTCHTALPMSEGPVWLHFSCMLLSSHCGHPHSFHVSAPPGWAVQPAARSQAQWCLKVESLVSRWNPTCEALDLKTSQEISKIRGTTSCLKPSRSYFSVANFSSWQFYTVRHKFQTHWL